MERCITCEKDREWHETHEVHHEFNGSLTPRKKSRQKSEPEVLIPKGIDGDPALRLALISAGVITFEQLLVAERTLDNARVTGQPAVIHSAD